MIISLFSAEHAPRDNYAVKISGIWGKKYQLSVNYFGLYLNALYGQKY